MPTPERTNDIREPVPLGRRLVHRAKLVRNALTERTPPALSAASFARSIAPGRFSVERDEATCAILARVPAQALDALRARIEADPQLAPTFAGTRDPSVQRHLLLAYGAWLGDPAVLASGLSPQQPPAGVHAMAHGPLAAAGGVYEADLVANALASAGVAMPSIERALDFGCSSGRVLRVLAAAFPDVHWIGCDPNAGAIAWASETFPALEWFVSPNQPPLALGDGSLQLAFAISIWSHFAPPLGLRWFEEMHRVLAPGGHLVFTTHGPTAIDYGARTQTRPLAECEEMRAALYRDGCWFVDPFGEEGDWGVVNPDWGTAFLTPEWVLGQLCPRWRVVEFVTGRNQGNQDVYVLARA